MIRGLKMKKIFSVLLTALFLLLMLCGCGVENTGRKKGDKTVFIYMCGSNLETKQGLAGKNIDEILTASVGDDVNIVIETGGAATWRSHNIDNNALQRYEVAGGSLNLIESLPNGNMGESETLGNFLKWGMENYPAEHNMLVFWDHGGGSAKGVCFDENYSFDSLSLAERKI